MLNMKVEGGGSPDLTIIYLDNKSIPIFDFHEIRRNINATFYLWYANNPPYHLEKIVYEDGEIYKP